MKLKWHGHSCFSYAFDDGTVIVSDPFDGSVGYPLCEVRADAALLSHGHYDHNYVQSLQGDPAVIADSAARCVGGVRVRGIDCFHDACQGAQRGKNILFVIEGDGLRIAHMGDLGHIPTPQQCDALQNLDVMLLPIGGTYTITTPEAVEIARMLRPHTTIAMHFRNALCAFPIVDPTEFIRLTGAQTMPRELEITPETLEQLPRFIVPQVDF